MSKVFEVDFRKGTLRDLIGNILPTIASTPTLVQTEKGTALLCNGASQTLSYVFTHSGLGARYYELWFKCRDDNAYSGVVNFASSSNSAYLGGGTLTTYSVRRASGNYNTFSITSGLAVNMLWHHVIAYIPDDTTTVSGIRLWIDGIEMVTSGSLGNALITLDRVEFNKSLYIADTSYIAYFAINTGAITQQIVNDRYKDFANSKPSAKSKTNFFYPKPTDLSRYKGTGANQGLVAAYNMKPEGGVLVDISGNGRNGVITNCGTTLDGLKFNSNAIAKVVTTPRIYDGETVWTMCFVIRNDVSPGNEDTLLFNTSGGAIGTVLNFTNARILQWSTDFGAHYMQFSGALNEFIVNKNTNQVFTLVSNGTTISFYYNGVFKASITPSGFTTCANYINAFNSQYSGAGTDCEWIDARFYNRALSLQEIKDYHNQFATQIYLREDFSDCPADGTNILPREWIAGTGSYKCGEIALTQGNLVPNGIDMPDAGGDGLVDGWVDGVGTGSKSIVTGNGFIGRAQRIQANVDFSNVYIRTGANFITKKGARYRISFEYRCNASIQHYIYDGAVSTLVNTPSSGGVIAYYKSEVQSTVSSGGFLAFYVRSSLNAMTGDYFEIGQVRVEEIPPLPTIKTGSKYLECTVAGTIARASSQAFGTWEFNFYKGADANIMEFCFINTVRTGYPPTGYYFGFNSGERIEFYRAGVQKMVTANSYLTNFTWYRARITETLAGTFTFLLKGGNLVPTAGYDGWHLITPSSGTNPVTDNTYTTSNFFVANFGAGDRIGDIVFYKGIKQ